MSAQPVLSTVMDLDDICTALSQNERLAQRNAELEMRLLRYTQQQEELLPLSEDEALSFGLTLPTHRQDGEDRISSPLPHRLIDDNSRLSIPASPRPLSPQTGAHMASPRVILSKENMSVNEKRYLVYDMLKSRRRCGEMLKGLTTEITMEECDEAIDFAFEDWNTSMRPKPLPRAYPAQHRSSRYRCATFSSDCTRTSHPPPSRQKGADIFLLFHPDNTVEANRFQFRDSRGTAVKAELVQPLPDTDLDASKQAIMTLFDEEELAIVRRFNHRLMVATAQLRLVQFASRGNANKDEPFFDPKLEKKHLGFITARTVSI